MKELVISNLNIVVDARGDDPLAQVYRVIEAMNAYGDKCDGSPQIFMREDTTHEIRDNGEDGDWEA